MYIQEDYEKWEPKLPKDYKEIIQKSKCPEIYSTIKKEDLYNIFSKRILLPKDNMVISSFSNLTLYFCASCVLYIFIRDEPKSYMHLNILTLSLTCFFVVLQLMSFDGIGERNAMVSATLFSYKNSCPHEWKSLPESRLFSLPLFVHIYCC